MEVGHASEDARPVLAHLGAALERSTRVRGLLTAVVGREAGDERVDVVPVRRGEQAVHHDAHVQSVLTYSMRRPLIARAMTSRWISEVPSKIV